MSSNPPYDPAANPPRRKHRWLPWVLLGLFAALIALALRPARVPVETDVAAEGALRVTVNEEGRTRVRQRHVISAPVAGQLRRIPFKPGAPVEAGRTVVAGFESAGAGPLDARSLDQARARTAAAEAALGQAEAQAVRADAALELARTELRRAETLASEGAVSTQELDVARTRGTAAAQEARAATFGRQIAAHDLEQARALLRFYDAPEGGSPVFALTSPVTGRVLRVFEESARLVPAGTPLLEVGDTTDLEVVIEVLSRDGAAIAPGAEVLLEQWGGDEPLKARVRLVEPSAFTKISALGVEEQRVNVIADFADPPEARPTLGDAYRVEARIVTWEGGGLLLVPAGALFQRAGAWRVFVVEGGRARERTVEPGRSDGSATAIVKGLAAGDRVVVFPGDRVSDGMRVREL